MNIGLVLYTHEKLYNEYLSNEDEKVTFGGIKYWRALRQTLQSEYEFESFNINKSLGKLRMKDYYFFKWKYNKSFFLGKKLWIIDDRSVASIILNELPVRFIVLVHDYSHESLMGWRRKTIFKKNIAKINSMTKVITVSNFWKEYLISMGFTDIEIIHNYFNFEEYEITKEEIDNFKSKYGFLEKPIVYIGNCQEKKGVKESYEALKDMNVELVTSGNRAVEIPCMNLNLSSHEYRVLLAAADVVVTMSKFEEGWCRTTHEAMLCKTPVVGSGLGGMKELLEGGKQLIASDFTHLKESVEYLLKHPEYGEIGYHYASRNEFSYAYFQDAWRKVVNESIFK